MRKQYFVIDSSSNSNSNSNYSSNGTDFSGSDSNYDREPRFYRLPVYYAKSRTFRGYTPKFAYIEGRSTRRDGTRKGIMLKLAPTGYARTKLIYSWRGPNEQAFIGYQEPGGRVTPDRNPRRVSDAEKMRAFEAANPRPILQVTRKFEPGQEDPNQDPFRVRVDPMGRLLSGTDLEWRPYRGPEKNVHSFTIPPSVTNYQKYLANYDRNVKEKSFTRQQRETRTAHLLAEFGRRGVPQNVQRDILNRLSKA